MKKFLNVVFSAAAAIALIGCGIGAAQGADTKGQTVHIEEETAVSELTDFDIYCFKIGKADSFVMQTENSVVVLDTGETEDSEEIMEYLDDEGITDIDYLIISHFDKDHVGGAADIILNYNIEHILQPNASEDSDEYAAYVSALKSVGTSPEIVSDTYTFFAGRSKFYSSSSLKRRL